MKQLSIKTSLTRLRICIIATLLVIASLFLFSFTTRQLADDFLKQLGITKATADEKITGSILGGYLDQYGAGHAKNIIAGNRAAVAKDLMNYTKQYVNSPAFIKAYHQLKESQKPVQNKLQSPEEMRTQMIDLYRKSVTETEVNMKKADASIKKIFEDALAAAKKQLKEAEDPNNRYISSYKQNYEQALKSNEASNKAQLSQWEIKYPDNHLLFVKVRLQEFMNETEGIDFEAALIEKNGKRYFANPAYEHKGNRWKMAFRAGKEVIGTARQMARQWIDEIK